jgi:hypothetical protein
MRLIPAIAVACTLTGAAISYAPSAEAARVVVGLGIGVPGFAVAAPIYAAPGPYYYGAPYAYYPVPPVVAYRPWFRGYYGRPYVVRRGWR